MAPCAKKTVQDQEKTRVLNAMLGKMEVTLNPNPWFRDAEKQRLQLLGWRPLQVG